MGSAISVNNNNNEINNLNNILRSLQENNNNNNNNSNNNNIDLEEGRGGGEANSNNNNNNSEGIQLTSLSSIIPQIHNTNTVKSLINIEKDTIRFQRTDIDVIHHQDQINNFKDSENNNEDSVNIEINDNSEKTTTTTTTTTEKRANGEYDLTFVFDSEEPCIIDIDFSTFENIDETFDKRITSKLHLGPFNFPAGLNQKFILSSFDQSIDLSNFYESEILNCNFEKSLYPMIITLKTTSFNSNNSSNHNDNSNNNSTVSLSKNNDQSSSTITTTTTTTSTTVSLTKNNESDNDNKLKAQQSFLTLLKCNDSTFALKPLKQKTFFNDKVFLVHDIYGIEAQLEDNKECVACLNDPKEVLAIPCRHFCLCSKCAEVMRSVSIKCPICRSPIRALLKIDLKQLSNNNINDNNGNNQNNE